MSNPTDPKKGEDSAGGVGTKDPKAAASKKAPGRGDTVMVRFMTAGPSTKVAKGKVLEVNKTGLKVEVPASGTRGGTVTIEDVQERNPAAEEKVKMKPCPRWWHEE